MNLFVVNKIFHEWFPFKKRSGLSVSWSLGNSWRLWQSVMILWKLQEH
jgi:hypothetical protein